MVPMIEVLLVLCGIALGLTAELGLMVGVCLAFIAAVFAAMNSPSRELLDGVPFSLWLLLPLIGVYCLKGLSQRRTKAPVSPTEHPPSL